MPSRYSVLGPPLPRPEIVTVSSPPERITAGLFWFGSAAILRASAACSAPTRRASPSRLSPSTIGSRPSSRALAAAAASASLGVATRRYSARARRGSPGFGVSSAAASRCAFTAGAGSILYFARIARASAKVLGSGTVGPEPITEGSSPTTSEIASVSTRAGVAAARRPPLIAERCFRTQLISWIVAPLLSSARVVACLSARATPGAGSTSSAEAPPDIRHSTRSSAFAARTISSMRPAAARPRSSGTGCDASIISILKHGTP